MPAYQDTQLFINGVWGPAASGRTLHELLSDILDLAKIEARAVKLEDIAFNPVAMVTDSGDAYRELAANRGTLLTVKIDPTLPAQLAGDPTRLRQVLSNLAGNAVKFTEHGEITVGVYVNDRRDRTSGKLWLRFTVRDTGIGITHAGLFYFIAIFAGVLVYALRPSARRKFEEAARIPLDEK